MTPTDPQEVGQRIEALLGELGEPAVTDVAEELVRLLMGMYGAGLERIVSMLAGSALEGPALLSKLLEDDLVSSLLVLHDLHPEDTSARVARALETVRPYLGSHAGGVELLGVADEPEGVVVTLRLKGSCDGCPSSAMTVKTAIEKAIVEACPEVLRVDVEGMNEPAASVKELPLLQIQSGPPVETSWVVLDDPSLRPGQCATLDVEGCPVLLALPPGSGGLVAYRNRCPVCRGELDGAPLTGDRLFCPSCQAGYDVRKAGRALTGGLHLEPLPLVTRAGGLRLAIPRPTVGAAS
ncbi:NifU family protein [Pseudonocardia spinosispora]|uniref:NifU family protein n=1 Tax=Pseudonocardia spinosispora TaxID=103441 RepID=UPI00048B6AB5|nr:NifU family protein [Pseudonocardia spinosispora]